MHRPRPNRNPRPLHPPRRRYISQPLADGAEDTSSPYLTPMPSGAATAGWLGEAWLPGGRSGAAAYLLPAACCMLALGAAAAVYAYRGKPR